MTTQGQALNEAAGEWYDDAGFLAACEAMPQEIKDERQRMLAVIRQHAEDGGLIDTERKVLCS